MEGTRPLLVEFQALVAPTALGTPRRAVVGWDQQPPRHGASPCSRRMPACGSAQHDVYLNVAGGLRITEPAADLAAAAALVSSLTGAHLPADTRLFRRDRAVGRACGPVAMATRRLKEAAKLGFARRVAPAAAQGCRRGSPAVARRPATSRRSSPTSRPGQRADGAAACAPRRLTRRSRDCRRMTQRSGDAAGISAPRRPLSRFSAHASDRSDRPAEAPCMPSYLDLASLGDRPDFRPAVAGARASRARCWRSRPGWRRRWPPITCTRCVCPTSRTTSRRTRSALDRGRRRRCSS